MKVLKVGDTHMNMPNIISVLDYAEKHECSTILSVGDFGYWPHLKEGRIFLNYLKHELPARGIKFHFIKGNHENHEALGQFSKTEITEILPNLYYHPNLTVWKWGLYKFCAIGGAYSTDGWKRTFGVSKWPEEEISMAEVYGCSDIKADIVISHDCPLSVDISHNLHNKVDPYTQGHRSKLQCIVDTIQPKYLIHGHYHVRFLSSGTHENGSFVNVGLASNKQSIEDQCMVFDCANPNHNFSTY